MSSTTLTDALLRLVSEYQDFNSSRAEVLESAPNALEFSRLVAAGRPALIKGLGRSFLAFRAWTPSYLSKAIAAPVEIAVTPSGNADALVAHPDNGKTYFVEPHKELMPVSQFFELLERRDEAELNPRGEVHYLQSQNGNLADKEFAPLRADVPPSIDFVDQALGRKPDAVNIWVGDERSTTSLHKDPYENIYVVLTGSKTFALFPPTEGICLHESLYPAATYTRRTPSSALELTPSSDAPPVSWISVDPLSPAASSQSPRFAHARPVTVTVAAGDALYLPGGWYHHVQQAGRPCVAVNYWYDQEYAGERFAMREFLRAVTELAVGEERLEGETAARDQ